MANVTRMEQGVVMTDKGPFNIPFIYIDAPLQSSVPNIRYQLAQFNGMKQDFCYKNGVGVNCSIGDKISFSYSGTNITVRCDNTTESFSTTNDVGFVAIVFGTDDYAIPWNLGIAGGPVSFNPTNGMDSSEIAVTTTSFGTYTYTSTHQGWFSNSIGGNISTLHYWADYILAHQPITYDWQAWAILQGNNGQYRQRLTALKSASIGDISTANYGVQNDFIFIAPNVDVVPYLRNMNYNSPVKIAWSGINWLTVEIVPVQNPLTNFVRAVFKFYAKTSSETVPIYSETHDVYIASNAHFYLSFVYDDEHTAALFLPVRYTVGSTGTPFSWGNAGATDNEMLLLWQWLQASGSPDPDPIPEGPYDNGTTDNGGGGGNPTPQDNITTENVPTLGAMASGMFTVYCPTDIQLAQIAAYLWSDNFIDNVKKYFNNVSDNIIAFYVLPLEPDSLPTKNFKIGNLENTSITGVKYLTSRFMSVDMGELYVDKRWETYLDFSPFTKFSLYLPAVGVVALDSDDIMSPANLDGVLSDDLGSRLSISYVVDLMASVVVAYVKINGQIRYQFSGKTGYSIPLTGQNYTAMGTGFVTAMAGLAATIASGGTAAPFTAGATAAGIVNAMKPEVYRGSNLSGDASMLSLKTPILIRKSPNKPALANQPEFTGAPSYKIDTIGNFAGFTQVVEAHIEGISCTTEERNEIMQLLQTGVLI